MDHCDDASLRDPQRPPRPPKQVQRADDDQDLRHHAARGCRGSPSRCGADALGFVFWPDSPRSIDPSRARAIAARAAAVCDAGRRVRQPAGRVRQRASRAGRGSASCSCTATRASAFAASLNRPVIKAMTLRDDAIDRSLARRDDGPARRARSGAAGRHRTDVDWTAAAAVAARRPIVLAGGLNPDNVAEPIERVRPFGIDVSSGVEAAPGIKDHRRLKQLFEAVREAEFSSRHKDTMDTTVNMRPRGAELDRYGSPTIRRDPDARGYFGEFGGRFVPETLVEPVEELERAYFAVRDDPGVPRGARSAAEALRRPADAGLRGGAARRRRPAARGSS